MHFYQCVFNIGGTVPDYQVPFTDVVGMNPTLETMTRIVVTEKKRPHLFEVWNTDKARSASSISSYEPLTPCQGFIGFNLIALRGFVHFVTTFRSSSKSRRIHL